MADLTGVLVVAALVAAGWVGTREAWRIVPKGPTSASHRPEVIDLRDP